MTTLSFLSLTVARNSTSTRFSKKYSFLSSNHKAVKLSSSCFSFVDKSTSNARCNNNNNNNNLSSRFTLTCMSISTDVPPTVSDTKQSFLKAYSKPIPSIYNTVLQELLVQQHLMRYKNSYRYDPVFALGFVTVYDRLMEGYPSEEDRAAIFRAHVNALNEDPDRYRADAKKLEEWGSAQSATTLVGFSSREGEVESILKEIAERAGSRGSFSYSRFFAIGLFRLLELANAATDANSLEKLCSALNVNKKSVDRDLDVYRNLLTKLVQAKELLKEYVEREKKKRAERAGTPTASEAVKQCMGEYQTLLTC